MNQLDPIEEEIVAAVQALPQQKQRAGWESDRRWTAALKAALGQLGRGHGYDVCASGWGLGDGQCWPEWLYDVTWVQMRDGRLVEVPLILECEWNFSSDTISPDFEKLMVGRADHRVVISGQNTAQEIRDLVRTLKKEVCGFKKSVVGDRYLFLGYDVSSARFLEDLFVAPGPAV